jgi:hypothetical protein
VSKITFTVSKSSGWRLRETRYSMRPELMAIRHPALRRQELCLGLPKEQEKLPLHVKGKWQKPAWESQKLPKAKVVADGAVVAEIPKREPEKSRDKRSASPDGFLLYNTLKQFEYDFY